MILENSLELHFENVTVRLLNESYGMELTELAKNEKIWEYYPIPFHDPEIFKKKWLDKAFEEMKLEKRYCFVIFRKNELIGSSSYYEIDHDNKRLVIGYTWFHPSCWGTRLNPISKLILMDYAFETLKFNRIGFAVDSINLRSCKALKKLGIKEEGVLRNHMVLANGRIRHSVIFSVIREEWPETKNIILNRIQSDTL